MSTMAMADAGGKKVLRWWHLVLILVLVNFISSLPAQVIGYDIFYNSFRQPSFAPPAWLFAPLWLFLNITSLIALQRIANAPAQPGRVPALIAEAVAWLVFALFTLLYFGLRSPILGALDTVVMWACTGVSVVCAWRIDRWAFGLLVPRLLWLTLASVVGVTMAVMNADPFFQRVFG